jgi:hypothetical protein
MDGAVVLKLDRDGKATPARCGAPPTPAHRARVVIGALADRRFRGDSLEHDTVALVP